MTKMKIVGCHELGIRKDPSDTDYLGCSYYGKDEDCRRSGAGALPDSTDAGSKVRCSLTRSTTTLSATTSCADAPKLL